MADGRDAGTPDGWCRKPRFRNRSWVNIILNKRSHFKKGKPSGSYAKMRPRRDSFAPRMNLLVLHHKLQHSKTIFYIAQSAFSYERDNQAPNLWSILIAKTHHFGWLTPWDLGSPGSRVLKCNAHAHVR